MSRRDLGASLLAWRSSCLVCSACSRCALPALRAAHPSPTLAWMRGGTTYELARPKMLGSRSLAPWFVVDAARARSPICPGRSAFFACCCASRSSRCSRSALARWRAPRQAEKVCTVYLVDVSDSVPDAALEDAAGRDRRASTRASPKDVLVGSSRSRGARGSSTPRREGARRVRRQLARHDDAEGKRPTSAPPPTSRPRCSSPTASIRPATCSRAVLLSDGVQTDGDLLAEANRAQDFGVKVFTIPYRRRVPGEVAVRELRVPERCRSASLRGPRRHLREPRGQGRRPCSTRARRSTASTACARSSSSRATTTWSSRASCASAGEVTYALELDPNRRGQASRRTTATRSPSTSPGGPRCSTSRASRSAASYALERALGAGVRRRRARARAFPGSLRELERYDFVILSDTPRRGGVAHAAGARSRRTCAISAAASSSPAARRATASAAGTTPRSSASCRCAWTPSDARTMPSVAMALVIDRSGSMTGLPLEMAKAAAQRHRRHARRRRSHRGHRVRLGARRAT